jgi:hypothetical protein
MVVAAHPGSDINRASEIDLVKAALLYGDEVRLLSPAMTMLLRTEALGEFSLDQLLDLRKRQVIR